jgi:hypothetical protein
MMRSPGMYCASQNCGSAIQIWKTDQKKATSAISSATARLAGRAPGIGAGDQILQFVVAELRSPFASFCRSTIALPRSAAPWFGLPDSDLIRKPASGKEKKTAREETPARRRHAWPVQRTAPGAGSRSIIPAARPRDK